MKKKKKRLYNEQVIEIEYGSVTPLVISAAGGIGRECKKFYSRFTELISSKRDSSYSIAVAWIRTKITFSLINSLEICLRGSRSIFCNDSFEKSLDRNIHASEAISTV